MDLYAIYLRKSRMDMEAEAHGEGETLKRHETALLALAKRREYCIGEIYREVVSGDTIAGRPEMQRLLADVEGGRWKGVLVMEESRLARGDTMDQGRVQQAFYYSHTLIVTPNKTFDPDSEADQEYFEFGLFMSRREYKTINRRLSRGRLASAKEGKWGGGRCPYGYKKVKLEREKGYTLEIVPEQAQVVRSMVDWYLKDDLPVYLIATKLNDAGIRTASDHTWTPVSVYSVLDNPVYCGLVRYGYRKVDRHPNGTKLHYRTEEQLGVNLFQGRHEPIMTMEEHEAIRKKHHIKTGKRGPAKSPLQNPLAGLCFCSCCGRAMVRSLGRHGEPRLWCKEYNCNTGTVGLKKVEKLLIDSLKERLAELEIPDEAAQERSNAEEAVLLSGLAAVRKELETVAGQKSRAFDLVEQGVYTPEVFTGRMEALTAHETELKEKRDEIQSRLDHLETTARQQKELVPKIRRIIELYPTLEDAQRKNDLLKESISSIVLRHPVRTTELSMEIYYLL